MSLPCPSCRSTKTICISSARRIALAAKAINRLIIRHLSTSPTPNRSPIVLDLLEELAGRLLEALDMSLKIKYQQQHRNFAPSHVCMRCGHLFGMTKQTK